MSASRTHADSVPAPWDLEQALDFYQIPRWGDGFFDVSPQGHLTVAPRKENGPVLALPALVEEIAEEGIFAPLLLRFTDILHSRVAQLAQAFQEAIAEYSYQGAYFPVYPIKVNQQRGVVEELMAAGRRWGLGLEAGSKPELQIVLANARPGEVIVCNGYKDDEFIHLALMGTQLGFRLFIVLEKSQELPRLIRISRELGIRPRIGLRIKLDNRGSGRWVDSGGIFSKFGLSAPEILDAVKQLEEAQMLDCIQLLHFHLGSQITDLRRIKSGMLEASRFYAALRKLGCPVDHVDVGGGLGVDYDGSRSTADHSANYSIQDYANDVVGYLDQVCQQENLPHPNIVSESGRALTAHHAVLVVDVLEVVGSPDGQKTPGSDIQPTATQEVAELAELLEGLEEDNALAVWLDAMQLKDDFQNKFALGVLSLEQRALGERLFFAIARKVHKLAENLERLPPELEKVSEYLHEKFFCNFSIFQSLPDNWALNQPFPVVPLQRLHEAPDHLATLQDITCDSDGGMDCFIGDGPTQKAMQLHAIQPGESYQLGIFLVGAYQEILGDLHNLFGDTNVVQVTLDGSDRGYRFQSIQRGDRIRDVLRYVAYDPEELVHRVDGMAREALKKGGLTREQARAFTRAFRAALDDYTYLEGRDGE
ncbi:MAG: biosynthetic arginine decarboxylase [Magnetococcales bacterium]|nr:biosynthetic arginine decarboxylase [Magnetococcales bacterium]